LLQHRSLWLLENFLLWFGVNFVYIDYRYLNVLWGFHDFFCVNLNIYCAVLFFSAAGESDSEPRQSRFRYHVRCVEFRHNNGSKHSLCWHILTTFTSRHYITSPVRLAYVTNLLPPWTYCAIRTSVMDLGVLSGFFMLISVFSLIFCVFWHVIDKLATHQFFTAYNTHYFVKPNCAFEISNCGCVQMPSTKPVHLSKLCIVCLREVGTASVVVFCLSFYSAVRSLFNGIPRVW